MIYNNEISLKNYVINQEIPVISYINYKIQFI